VNAGTLLETLEALREITAFPTMESIARESRTATDLDDGHSAFEVELEPPLAFGGDKELGVMGHHSHSTVVSDMIVHHTTRS